MVRWTFLHGMFACGIGAPGLRRMDDDVHHSVHGGYFLLVIRPGDGDVFRSGTLRTYTALVLDVLLVDTGSKQDVR